MQIVLRKEVDRVNKTIEENNISKEDRRIVLMRDASPAKAIVKMSLPVTLGMIITVFYNMVDTFFIGKLNNEYQLAAANLAYPAMMICMALCSIIGTGAASYIARSLGAEKKERADATLSIGLFIILLMSAGILVLGNIFIKPLVQILGASDNTFQYTLSYVRVIIIGNLFIMGNYVLGQMLRAEGSTMMSISGMVVGTISNIILDPIMIFAFRWGITGAAVATVLGNVFGVLLYLSFYVRKKTLLRPSIAYVKKDKEILKEIFWVGVPATVEQLLTSTAYMVNNNLAASYSDTTVAAMGVAQKVMTLGVYIYMGFAAGTQPLMGYNFGAKNYKRMNSLYRTGLLIICGIEGVIMVIFGVFGENIMRIFTSITPVVSLGVTVLHAFMLYLPLVAVISMTRSSFQSMGKPQYAFLITLIRQLILYIPMLFIMNNCLGFQGLIHTQPVTDLITTALSITLLTRIIGKCQNNLEADD